MNQQVTEYIEKITQAWQAEICSGIRQIIGQAFPDIEERIQYGKPHFLKNGKYAFVLGTAKEWVTFTIFNAQDLEAPDGYFEDGDPNRKTVKFRKGQTVDYAFITQLVQHMAGAK